MEVGLKTQADREDTVEEPIETGEQEQLKSTKEEINKVREENERLKSTLSEILDDYQSLQSHFSQILQQDNNIKESAKTTTTALFDLKPASYSSSSHDDEEEEDELVSLSLGKIKSNNSGHDKKEEDKKLEKKDKSERKEGDEELTTLKLGFNYNNIGEEEGNREQLPPWPSARKVLEKDLGHADDGGGDEVQQVQRKKARVSLRTRCDATTVMNDGCQWRKYGQKVAKGNPCPRAYYRCTLSPGCPVRKQVQRCLEDKSILITTYEGTHNHPLPASATAMASTTSAAASMLHSGPSSASEPASASPDSTTSRGLNLGIFNASRQRQQFYCLQNPTFSSATSKPTVTLDLTSSQPTSTPQENQFNLISSSSFTTIPRYSSTSFNFSPSSEPNTTAKAWSITGHLSYGPQQPKISSTTLPLNLGRQSQESPYQPHLQKAANPNAPPVNQHWSTDTTTKAITTEPSFQSALQAAISSHIGAHGAQTGKEGQGHGACFNLLADRMNTD